MSSTIRVVTANNLGSGLPIDENGDVIAVSVSRQVISSARSVFITTQNQVVPVEDWSGYIFGYFKIGLTKRTAQELADSLIVVNGKVTMPADMALASVTGFTEFSQGNSPSWPAPFGQPTLSHTASQLKFVWDQSLDQFPYIKPFVGVNASFGRWKLGTVAFPGFDFLGNSYFNLQDGNGSSLGNSYLVAPIDLTIVSAAEQATMDLTLPASVKITYPLELFNRGQWADETNPTPSEKLAFATDILLPAVPLVLSGAFTVNFADAANVAVGEQPDGTVITDPDQN